MNKFIAKTLDDRERVSREFFPPKKEALLETLNEAETLYLREEYSIDEKIKVRARFHQIRELIEQSPRVVTREWMEEKAVELIRRFDGECSLTSLQTVGIMTVLCEKGDLEDLLQELGIEVIK